MKKLITLYLIAIVLANLSVFYFGTKASILNAFLFIGLDITTRDMLHENWHGKDLFKNMSLLIVSGSLLSLLFNIGVYKIALASFIAFLVANYVDLYVYQKLFNKSKLLKINGSNVFSAAADSIIFPLIAFNGILFNIMLGQFVAKVLGGYVWSVILKRVSIIK